MEKNIERKLANDLTRSINEGNIEETMNIIQEMNKMAVRVTFNLDPRGQRHEIRKKSPNFVERTSAQNQVNNERNKKVAALSNKLKEYGCLQEQIAWAVARYSSVEASLDAIYSRSWD